MHRSESKETNPQTYPNLCSHVKVAYMFSQSLLAVSYKDFTAFIVSFLESAEYCYSCSSLQGLYSIITA